MNPERFRDQRITAAPGAQVQKVEISERTLSVIAFGFGVAAFMTALWSIHESDRAERETKQLQIQVMDMNALAIRNGWLKPTDEVYGPAGNLEYKPIGVK